MELGQALKGSGGAMDRVERKGQEEGWSQGTAYQGQSGNMEWRWGEGVPERGD